MKQRFELEREATEFFAKSDPLFYYGNERRQALYLLEHGWKYHFPNMFFPHRVWQEVIRTGGCCETTSQAYQNQKVDEYVALYYEKERNKQYGNRLA